MSSSVFRYTWEEVNRAGREYSLEFDISVDWSPITPAKTSGLPEDCYPAEGGDIEVTQVDLENVAEVLANDDLLGLRYQVEEPLQRQYWLERFKHEVENTSAFSDWLGEEVAEEERGANRPDDDDRDDERWGI